MLNYDFSELNDKEFESLCVDLISIDKNKRFERFKTGKKVILLMLLKITKIN